MTTLVAPKPSCGNFWSRARRFFACRPWRMSKRSLVMVGLRGLATSWIIWPSYIIFGIPGDLLSEINDFCRMIRWCSPQVKRLDCRATGEPWGYPGHFRRWLCTSTTAWSHGAAPRKLATTGCITDVWEQCIGLMVWLFQPIFDGKFPSNWNSPCFPWRSDLPLVNGALFWCCTVVPLLKIG